LLSSLPLLLLSTQTTQPSHCLIAIISVSMALWFCISLIWFYPGHCTCCHGYIFDHPWYRILYFGYTQCLGLPFGACGLFGIYCHCHFYWLDWSMHSDHLGGYRCCYFLWAFVNCSNLNFHYKVESVRKTFWLPLLDVRQVLSGCTWSCASYITALKALWTCCWPRSGPSRSATMMAKTLMTQSKHQHSSEPASPLIQWGPQLHNTWFWLRSTSTLSDLTVSDFNQTFLDLEWQCQVKADTARKATVKWHPLEAITQISHATYHHLSASALWVKTAKPVALPASTPPLGSQVAVLTMPLVTT